MNSCILYYGPSSSMLLPQQHCAYAAAYWCWFHEDLKTPLCKELRRWSMQYIICLVASVIIFTTLVTANHTLK